MSLRSIRGRLRTIRKGTRFEALADIQARGLIHWKAPLTTGFRCVIPKGTVLVAFGDFAPFSLGFSRVPEDSVGFERMFVPEEHRKDDRYGGYSFTFTRLAIGSKLRML